MILDRHESDFIMHLKDVIVNPKSRVTTYLLLKLNDGPNLVGEFLRLNYDKFYVDCPRLNDDFEFVMMVTRYCPYLFKFISERLRNNYIVAHSIVRYNGGGLVCVSNQLRDDYNLVLAAIKSRWSSIELASERLRDNYSVIRSIVGGNGQSLGYVSARLRDDYDIVLAAVEDYGPSIQWVSERLRDNYEIAMATGGSYFETSFGYLSKRLRSNISVVVKHIGYLGQDDGHQLTTIVQNLESHVLENYEVQLAIFEKVGRTEYLLDGIEGHRDPVHLLKSWISLRKGNGLIIYRNDYDLKFMYPIDVF